MKNWTTSQQEAINAKGATLIAASAGTGKTAVITEKIANIIIHENVDVGNILAVTFSNNAAEEMKARIDAKFQEEANKEGATRALRKRIFLQKKLLHTANIKTIHAFAHDVVKKYGYTKGLSSSLEIGDTLYIAILKRKAISQVLNEEFKAKDKDFLALIETFDDSETLEDIFINAHEKIYNNIDPIKWLEFAVNLYNVSETEMPDFMQEKLIKDFSDALSFYNQVKFEIEALNNPKLDKALITIEKDIAIIENILVSLNKKDLNTFNTGILSEFGTTIRFASEFTAIKNLRNKGKEIIEDYKKNNFNIADQLYRIKHMYPIVKKFAEIIIKFDNQYAKLKQDENIIDFSDMERFANDILDNPNISMVYKNTFKYVFVDEYQDTSPIQESIIKKVSNITNLYCVGDQKQSIYGFRSAEPELFLSRNKAYEEKTLPGKVIPFNKNFRSHNNVLYCNNDVSNHIAKQYKDLVFGESDELIASREDKTEITPTHVNLLPDNLKEIFEDLSADELEILNLVHTINKKLEGKVYDPELQDYREVKYSDITILCRKLTGLSDALVKIFKANKIPFIIEKSGGLLETVEIQNLLGILELSNNIDNDIYISAFIHEGFLGFNDNDLIDVKIHNRENTLYKNIVELSERPSDLGLKCKKFIDFFKSIKTQDKYLGLNELLNYIISTLNFMDYYAVQENGKQKIENIKLFQQYAFDYDQKHNDKIYGFLNYINELKNTSVIIDEAKVNYNENSVRITTIHKSKGLEYPIVILPFMNKAFSSIDKRANVSVDKNFGLGFRYRNIDKNEKGTTFIRRIINDAIADKTRKEEARLLYVAMTRAKEELIIQGTMSGSKTKASFESATSMLDWILSTILSEESVVEDGELSSKLTGKWQLNMVGEENIIDYVDKKLEPVAPEIFLSRYSKPSTPKVDEFVQEIDKNIPTAISASRILQEQESPFKLPKFKAKVSAANVGTAAHSFLKYLDFNKDTSYFGLMDQLEEMVNKNLIKKEDADLVDLIKIEKFLETDLAKDIKTAQRIERERPISILETADNIGFYSRNTKQVLVRCILDMMFEKDGEWYLVDYKTDKIYNENDDDELTNKILSHRTQLSLYEKAIKQIYGITIKDTYIVFLDIGKAFKIFKYD